MTDNKAVIKPYTRDTARPHLGKLIKRKEGTYSDDPGATIEVLGVTDSGVFLGKMECGPFITYEWMLDNCIWADGTPCGVAEDGS